MKFATQFSVPFLTASVCFAQTDPGRFTGNAAIKSTCWDPAAIGQATIEPLGSELRKLQSKQGILLIEALINPDGNPDQIKYIAGPLGHAQNAISWVKRCLFIPATVGEKQVRERVYIKIRANPTDEKLQYAFSVSPSPKIDDWRSVPEK